MERIQKYISRAGRLSRRAAEDAVRLGRVSVNGKIVTEMGLKVNPASDIVRLDHIEVKAPAQTVTLLLHKPKGVVTSKSDPEGRKTVLDLLPIHHRALNPVGRLDLASEGMLLLTNDGDLHQRVTHPRNEIKKTYLAWVDGTPTQATLNKWTDAIDGVELEDGFGHFDEVHIVRKEPESQRTLIAITTHEGRNRFIRRMCEALGHRVIRLKRIQIGTLAMPKDLKPGRYVELTREQCDSLYIKS